jgi:hypothetical protein
MDNEPSDVRRCPSLLADAESHIQPPCFRRSHRPQITRPNSGPPRILSLAEEPRSTCEDVSLSPEGPGLPPARRPSELPRSHWSPPPTSRTRQLSAIVGSALRTRPPSLRTWRSGHSGPPAAGAHSRADRQNHDSGHAVDLHGVAHERGVPKGAFQDGPAVSEALLRSTLARHPNIDFRHGG